MSVIRETVSKCTRLHSKCIVLYELFYGSPPPTSSDVAQMRSCIQLLEEILGNHTDCPETLDLQMSHIHEQLMHIRDSVMGTSSSPSEDCKVSLDMLIRAADVTICCLQHQERRGRCRIL